MKRRIESTEAESHVKKKILKSGDSIPTNTAIGLSTYGDSNIGYASNLPGRRSFGNFNPFIEKEYVKIMELLKCSNHKVTASSVIDDDDTVIKRYGDLVGLPRGPNQV